MASPIDVLTKNKTIKSILKALFKEKEAGKPGMSISELSTKTGIERHKLAGIVEVLAILGILVIFQMGMTKMVTFNPKNLETISKVLLINKGARM